MVSGLWMLYALALAGCSSPSSGSKERAASDHARPSAVVTPEAVPEVAVDVGSKVAPTRPAGLDAQAFQDGQFRLYLPARGPIRFPVVRADDFFLRLSGAEELVPDTPYQDGEIASALARALDRASSLSMRDSTFEPLYLFADGDAEVARLERIRAVVPTSMAPRLVVSESGSAHKPAYIALPAPGAPLPAPAAQQKTVAELARALANP